MITGDSTKGKSVKAQVITESLIVVQESDILDTESHINNKNLSGKRKGSVVVCERTDGNLTLLVSTGASPEDAWQEGGADFVATE